MDPAATLATTSRPATSPQPYRLHSRSATSAVNQLAADQLSATLAVNQLAADQFSATLAINKMAAGQFSATLAVNEMAAGQFSATSAVNEMAADQFSATSAVNEMAAGQFSATSATAFGAPGKHPGGPFFPQFPFGRPLSRAFGPSRRPGHWGDMGGMSERWQERQHLNFSKPKPAAGHSFQRPRNFREQTRTAAQVAGDGGFL